MRRRGKKRGGETKSKKKKIPVKNVWHICTGSDNGRKIADLQGTRCVSDLAPPKREEQKKHVLEKQKGGSQDAPAGVNFAQVRPRRNIKFTRAVSGSRTHCKGRGEDNLR